MEKKVQEISNKLLKVMNVEEDSEIVKYGLHQIILITLNLLTIIVLGFIWKNVQFSLLFFFWFVTLRPFAGGYHADTELRCFLMSVVVLNIILFCKAYIAFFVLQYIILGAASTMIIVILAPVENVNNLLDETEIRVYERKTRTRITVYSAIMIISLLLKQEVLYSSIMYALLLVSLLLVAGKIKYRRFTSEKSF